jgi:hypothetical protein
VHSPLDRQIPMWLWCPHSISSLPVFHTHHTQSWKWFISHLTRCQDRLKEVSRNGWALRCFYAAAEIRQGHTAVAQIRSQSCYTQLPECNPVLRSIKISFKLQKKLKSALFWDITQRRVVIVYRRAPSHIESTSRRRLSFLLGSLTLEDGTDTLSRNVGKQLPHDAV